MTGAGFPHSEILGSRFVCQLPEAYRRLPRPSSAPDAKASTLCPTKLQPHKNKDARVHYADLKQQPHHNNQHAKHARGCCPGTQQCASPDHRPTPSTSNPPTPTPHAGARAPGGLLRKEVIQPHLPVRLPCYDLVLIASPTFDHSPPYGLGHGLRVLPTFMT